MKLLFLASLLGCLPAVFAAFGVTTSGSNMLVDSGGGLVTTSKLIYNLQYIYDWKLEIFNDRLCYS